MDNEVYKNYLLDLGKLISEMAFEAKKKSNDEYNDFNAGYLSGFHRVVSLMEQQAEAFGIEKKEIGIEEVDADSDLI